MTHPDVGKYSESLVSGTVRPVEVLIDGFKHLPTGDELTKEYPILGQFLQAMKKVNLGSDWSGVNERYPIIAKYDRHTENKDLCHLSVSSLPKSSDTMPFVCMEVSDSQGNHRIPTSPQVIKWLQQGIPLSSADVLSPIHSREPIQPINTLRGVFEEKGIEFKTFVGRHINATGREEDLIKEPGVFWVDSSGKLNLSVANPSIY